jgi:hypothetical protein
VTHSVWNSIRHVLDETATWGAEGCVTEEEYVHAAVEFANAKNWRSALTLRSGARKPIRIDNVAAATPLSELAGHDYAEWHAEFRNYLSEVVDRKPSVELRALIAAGAGRMIQISEPSLQPGPFSYRYVPLNLRVAFAHVFKLLLHPDMPYGKELCQCQLGSCRKFFFVRRQATGRPGRRYCKPEHMRLAHELDTARRVRVSRAKRKK